MRGRWTILGLVLFVAVDLLLVMLALRHVSVRESPDEAARSVTPSPTRAATPSPSVSSSRASPSSPATAGETAGAAKVSAPIAFLSVGGDGTVLRTTRGDCTGSDTPTVLVTPAGDKQPTTTLVPDLRQVVGTAVVSRRDLTVVGLDARCRAAEYASTDTGRTWTRRTVGDRTWHLAADGAASSVESPGGERSTPCVPLSVSAIDGSVARLLCETGRVLGTQDAGESWVALGRLGGAVDIGFTDPAHGVAIARRPGCPAAVMQTSDGGGTWTRSACLPGRRPRAVGAQGDVVAAQVGERLYVSTDAGTTWPRPTTG